jgi:glycosyltransferase involved in cell wall biosynthesis
VRIVYLSDSKIPSRSTNGMQVMRMCASFARLGHDVSLVRPMIVGEKPEGWDGDLWRFYGVRGRFHLVTLPTFFTRKFASSRWARPIRGVMWAAYLLVRCRPGSPPFVCYARSLLAARLAQIARRLWGSRSSCRGVAVELHAEPALRRSVSRADAVFVISDALRRRLLDRMPALDGKVEVEHDAADLEAIRPELLDRDAARGRLGLDRDGPPVVVYTGRVNVAKGAAVLLGAADVLAESGTRVILVGRVYEEELKARAARMPNVWLTGFVPPAQVADYVAAADVLVLPSTPSLAYAQYTSPLKLFEYMASGRPVVASDLPVLREILRDGENALLYPPESDGALAAAIRRLRDEPGLGSRLAEQAWRDVQTYSWDERARRISERLAAVAGIA